MTWWCNRMGISFKLLGLNTRKTSTSVFPLPCFLPIYISWGHARHCLFQDAFLLFCPFTPARQQGHYYCKSMCCISKMQKESRFENAFFLPLSPNAPQALLYGHRFLPSLQRGLFLLQQCISEVGGSQLRVKSWTNPISLPLLLSPFLFVCPFSLNIASRLMIHFSQRLLRLPDYTVKSVILFMFKIED